MCFKAISFFLPPAGSSRAFFSDIHCEDLVDLQELKLTTVGPPMTRLSEDFNSQICLHRASNNSSITVNVCFIWALVPTGASS